MYMIITASLINTPRFLGNQIHLQTVQQPILMFSLLSKQNENQTSILFKS